jgi:hypothetical protein
MFESRAAIGYDHGYDAQKFYLGLALDPKYVEGFMEGCLERIDEEDPDGETFLRDLWEEREVHQASKLPRLQQPPLVSLNAVEYALTYRRKGS